MKLRVTIDAQTYAVEVGDLNARPVLAVIDGETYEVWPEAAEAQTAVLPAARPASASQPVISAPAGAAPNGAEKVRSVIAPIPGVILTISVKPGDTVIFGQELCVLEAMKMKNLIRANRAGTVAKVNIATGDQVRHGQVMIEYTD